MKKLHDLLQSHFNKSSKSGDMCGEKGKGKLLKHVILMHVGIVILLALVIVCAYFSR